MHKENATSGRGAVVALRTPMATAASYSYSYAGALDAAWADVNAGASHAGEHSGHDGCSGVAAVLDRADQSGFSLTITAQPWQPKLVLQHFFQTGKAACADGFAWPPGTFVDAQGMEAKREL